MPDFQVSLETNTLLDSCMQPSSIHSKNEAPDLSAQSGEVLQNLISEIQSKQKALKRAWGLETMLPSNICAAPLNFIGRMCGRERNLVDFGHRHPFYYSKQAGQHAVLSHISEVAEQTIADQTKHTSLRHFDDVVHYGADFSRSMRKIGVLRAVIGPLGDDDCVDPHSRISEDMSSQKVQEILMYGLSKLHSGICIYSSGVIANGNTRFLFARLLGIEDNGLRVAYNGAIPNMTLAEAKERIREEKGE